MTEKNIELKRDVSLRNYTTIKIGGYARLFFTAHSQQDLCQIIKNSGGDFYLLGGGSNLLIKDPFINKAVIKLGKEFEYVKYRDNLVEVGGALPLAVFLKDSINHKLGGLENFAGLPATVGGMLVMNASSYGKAISVVLEEVEIMDREGNIKKLKKEEISFGYRFCSLKKNIVLRAWFKLNYDEYLKEKIEDFLNSRLKTQDFNHPSAGCIFKNPSGLASGFLIESCGFKGLKKNDAMVSMKHANFIINIGQAKFNDVDYLIQTIKEKVYQKHKVVLEEEVEIWD